MAATNQTAEAWDEQTPLDPLQYAVAARDRDVLSIVRKALSAGQARLAFQPIVRAGGQRVIAFHEGLIRVMDDTGRIIPAAQFMSVIEETDLGRELDCNTLRLALALLRQSRNLRLSINVSARSIGDMAWRRVLDQGLQGLPDLGERLILEISEASAMLLPELVIRFMAEMQPRGLAFALDGFGGGHTSFRHLKDFFFDLVKIDKSFVRNIHDSPDNQVIAEALITVAHQFEMFAVADGVETTQEAAHLTSIGVDCLQGYHFGVPRFTI